MWIVHFQGQNAQVKWTVFLMKAVDSSASYVSPFLLAEDALLHHQANCGFWKGVFSCRERNGIWIFWAFRHWNNAQTPVLTVLGCKVYPGEERSLSMHWACLERGDKALQVETANVSCTHSICTLISLCHFCLQMSDLPGEFEMVHLVLIFPLE